MPFRRAINWDATYIDKPTKHKGCGCFWGVILLRLGGVRG